MLKHFFHGLLLLLATSLCAAEQKQVFGDFEVHYSVINSTFLQPEIAERYDIDRGQDRMVVNISVRKRLKGDKTEAQKAKVTGKSSDLIHSVALDFNEVVEKDAVYYIAQIRVSNREPRSFEIQIQPDPAVAPYTLKFTKTLYHNE